MLPEYFPPAEDEAFLRVTRLIRRICVLREQGEPAESTRLEEAKLKTEIRDLRLAQGVDAVPDSRLAEIFETESKRAIEAVALADMIIPQLLGRLPAQAAPGGRGPMNGAPRPAVMVPAPDLQPATMNGSPAIPDLLDAMLAGERAPRRRA